MNFYCHRNVKGQETSFSSAWGLAYGLMKCLWNGHFARGQLSLVHSHWCKGFPCPVSQVCGWWWEDSFCTREGGKKEEEISRDTVDLRQCSGFVKHYEQCPRTGLTGGLANIDFLTIILAIVWATAPGLSQSPWGNSEINDHIPSLNRLYFRSSLENVQNSVCAQLSNKPSSNIYYRPGTELDVKVNKTHMVPTLNLGGDSHHCRPPVTPKPIPYACSWTKPLIPKLEFLM